MTFTQEQTDAFVAFSRAFTEELVTVVDDDDWEMREVLAERTSLAQSALDAALTGVE